MKKNMRKKHNIIAGSLLLIALIAGCSSGNGNNTQKSTPPQGPVNYNAIEAKFNTTYSTKANNNGLSLNSDAPATASCGKILGDVAKGIGLANGFLSLIPLAGPALAVVGSETASIYGLGASHLGSNCSVASDFANIEQQLTIQQNEINSLESYIVASNNQIWNAIANNSANIALIDYNNFNKDVNRFNGSDGMLMTVYGAAGFYNSNLQQLTSMTLSQLESSQTQLNSLLTEYNSMSNDDYASILSNVSGSTLNNSTCNTESGIPICYTNVSQYNKSDLMILLASTYSMLQESSVAMLNNGQNIVPLLDDYNNLIVSYYQQGLASIQALYHVAYLANYLNYFQSVQTPVVLPDFLLVPGTYYSPTSGIDYNTAQKNLTLLAAAMVNQLYQNVAGYIVTDIPVGSQAYPNNVSIPYVNENGSIVYNSTHTINYSKIISAKTSTALQVLTNALKQTTVPQTNASTIMLESALANNLQTLGTGAAPSLLFYQYAGIHNVANCVGNLESYNLQYGTNGTLAGAINNNFCPSLLVDVNGSPVNQSVLQPYTIQPYALVSNGLPMLSGNVTNNAHPQACSPIANGSIPAYNLYWYTPNSAYPSLGIPGTPYLMCGNWNVNANNLYGTNNGGQVLSNTRVYSAMLWASIDASKPININFPELMPSSVMAIDANPVWAQPSGTSLNPSSQGNIGISLPAIQSVNLSSYWPSYNDLYNQGTFHVAAVQTTLLDGFIAPYGVTTNNYEGMYLGPSQDDMFAGAVTVGLSYNPNVLAAGVTINGQPLYNTSDINTGPIPWNQNGNTQLTINQLNWAPVTSSNPSMNSHVSTIVVNGNRLVTVGATPTGTINNQTMYSATVGNVSVCVVDIANSHPSFTVDTAHTSLNNGLPPMDGALSSYYDNCLQGTGAGILDTNTSLWATGNNSITSQNGKYTLLLQKDGNLVLYSNIYTPSQAVVWSSGTAGTGSNNQLAMQVDGNLVIYSNGNAVWATRTPGSGAGSSGASNYLAVQNDGNLVVYSGPNLTNPVWASNTAQ